MAEAVWRHVREALVEAGIESGAMPEGPTPDLSLAEDLGVDSFQLMKLARHLEKAYDFRFSIADWVMAEEQKESGAFKLGSLVAFVQAHSP